MNQEVPQVISIVPIMSNGSISLKKQVKRHIGPDKDKYYYMKTENEVILTNKESESCLPAELRSYRLQLPEEILNTLGLKRDDLVAIIERKESVALKKMETEEREAWKARIIDVESSLKLTRVLETNPMPDELLPKLEEECKGKSLKYNVREFLQGRKSFSAWKARKLLGIEEASDDELRDQLIGERLEKQFQDGSWDGKVVLTAVMIRELGELGVDPKGSEISHGVTWLLNRAESEANPGMFFLNDKQVAKQAQVLEERKKGNLKRFSNRSQLEVKRVIDESQVLARPCGPKIMWANAFVLEALINLGYEENHRVQRTINTMMKGRWGKGSDSPTYWCECNYGHGNRGTIPTWEEIEQMERSYINQYTYGGRRGLEDLIKTGSTRTMIDHQDGINTYLLRDYPFSQNCEVITVRALSQVKNEMMRRIAEAHLWRFAGRQYGQNGEVPRGDYGFTQAGYLDVFSRYEHGISKVVILRSIPWAIKAQNEDGSWGDTADKDISTLAVIKALVRVKEHLPERLIP